MDLFSAVNVNGVFNSGLSFWQVVSLLVIVIIGIVTVRFTFSFDINKSREAKQGLYKQQIMNACPHAKTVSNAKGEHGLQSTYVSPPGTIQWQCQRCGHVTHPLGDEFNIHIQYYLDHFDEYLKQNNKFKKLLKKAGML